MDDPAQVFAVTPASFQADVVERSKQAPVVVLFWTEQDPPSAELKQTLETLIAQYQGKVLLGLVDVARDQALAQQLRVQTLPSLRVVQGGQLASQLDGPQTESVLRELLDGLTVSSSEMLRDTLTTSVADGDFETALAVLKQSIEEEPHNQAFRVELADVLVLKGDLGEAQQVIDGIPEETADLERPKARLELANESATMPALSELIAKHDADPENLEVCYMLAVKTCGEGDYEASLAYAMSILQTDREFRDDVGRTTMLRIFNLLGKGSELATRYRRQMFNYMH